MKLFDQKTLKSQLEEDEKEREKGGREIEKAKEKMRGMKERLKKE